MVNYKVCVDDFFMITLDDKTSADSICASLSFFFALEQLPYEARVESEVIPDA